MGEVRTQVTVFTEADLAECLRAAYHDTFNSLPSDNCLACAWAHVALECGRDGQGNIAKCRCYNLGNITASRKQLEAGADYWSIWCMEQQRDKQGNLNGQWVKTQMRFLAFDSLIAGALYYWRFLANRPRSLEALRAGHPRKLAYALAADHYMTANPPHYANGLDNLFPCALRVVQGLPAFDCQELVIAAPTVDDSLETHFLSLDDDARREVIDKWVYSSIDNMVKEYLVDPRRREEN